MTAGGVFAAILRSFWDCKAAAFSVGLTRREEERRLGEVWAGELMRNEFMSGRIRPTGKDRKEEGKEEDTQESTMEAACAAK